MKPNILFLLIVLFCFKARAQPGKNYTQFDRKKFHFGFALGVNTADLRYSFQLNDSNPDSIVSVDINKSPGFNLGIVSSLDLNQNIHIRFIPSLSFQERVFRYSHLEKGKITHKETRLESTTVDFPVMLKLRTKRINNFAAYALTGIQYSLDLASQEDTELQPGELEMKMKRNDLAAQFGGGFDFFMPYFKFSIELKISNGLNNLLIQDDTFFTRPLTSIKSKVWWFSITFEG